MGAMRWRSRLPLLLLAVWLASTLLLQWRWRLRDDADAFGAVNDGGWAAAVRHGSRLWAIAKGARKDYSVWSAVAAEATGAVQRANLSAIEQAQHAGVSRGRLDDSIAQHGEEQRRGQGGGSQSQPDDEARGHVNSASGSNSAATLLADELADAIPGDGSGVTMKDPAVILFASSRRVSERR